MKKSDISDQIYNSINPEYRHLFFEDENNNTNNHINIPKSLEKQQDMISILYQLKQRMPQSLTSNKFIINNEKVSKQFIKILKDSMGSKIYINHIIFYSKEANDHLFGGTNNYIFILPLLLHNGNVECIRIRFNTDSNDIELLECLSITQLYFELNSLEAYDMIKLVKIDNPNSILSNFILSKDYKAKEV